MKKSLQFFTLALLLFISVQSYAANKPKYIFLFIGDGMGISQVALTEAYLASLKGVRGSEPLIFSKFPSFGLCTTYSANYHITCSSAAGTALSTGTKTNNYMLGVDPDTFVDPEDDPKEYLPFIQNYIKQRDVPVGIVQNA